MSNVLSEEKKQQVIALGKLGWPLRRIEQATGVRRETAGAYLKAAGIGVRAPGGWGRRGPAKPANEVTTDPSESKPANEVTTDFGSPILLPTSNRDRVTSACEPYRELLEQGLGRGRNAMAIWQDLVSDHGFPHGYQTVKRFVHKLRGSTQPQAVGDDLGMRKLAPTAAEELLEIVMRRHERASTLLTSNRPVEDWGKLLGDSAAVTATLDRLLHHGHILKCGPRSWRTKTDLPDQEKMG